MSSAADSFSQGSFGKTLYNLRREVDWLGCQGLLDLKIKFEEERKAMRVDPDASIGYLKVLIGAKFGVGW